MLSREQLEALYREVRDEAVLSVYIDGGQSDPANRRAWRTAFDGAMAEERRRIETEAPEELEAFDAARGLIEDAVAGHKEFMPAHGWVAFATGEALRYADGVPVPMPNLVRWERGLRAAPYVRALKQERVVVGVLADRRRARVFTYREGAVSEHDELVADADFGDLSESAASTRGTGQSGSRGETGSDAGQRAVEVSASRMHSLLLDRVGELAGHDGFVILGGTPEVVSAVAKQAGGFRGRLLERPDMHLDMSEAEVKTVLEDAASELTRGLQDELLSKVVDAARSGGKGSLGIQATKEALREGRVDALLVSRGFRERDGDLVDRFVGTAFEQGAMVEELSEAGAARLDEEGEGVAARLRYTL
jgi:hypothetical protein